MRVGLFVDHFDPAKGGLESALAQLARHLEATGHETRVYGLTAAPGAPGTHVQLELPAARRGALERLLAARSLESATRDGCDVTLAVRHCPQVDVYWPHGGSHAATLAAGEAAKGGATGAVSRMLHRLSPRHRDFLDLERVALEGGARRVWCVSQLVRDEFAEAYPGSDERLELHPNGVDRSAYQRDARGLWRDRVRSELAVPPEVPVLLFMGGNLRLKGWYVLREALTRLLDRPWHCVVAGADVDHVRADVRAAGLDGRVTALPHRAAQELYGVADLMLQPTYRDPCSLATLEALASGVPVLTTLANGASDALTDALAGESVPPGDTDAYTTALRAWVTTVSDPVARAEAATAARACTGDRDATDWLHQMTESLARMAG